VGFTFLPVLTTAASSGPAFGLSASGSAAAGGVLGSVDGSVGPADDVAGSPGAEAGLGAAFGTDDDTAVFATTVGSGCLDTEPSTDAATESVGRGGSS